MLELRGGASGIPRSTHGIVGQDRGITSSPYTRAVSDWFELYLSGKTIGETKTLHFLKRVNH